jgi:signal transduction histidine kinase
VPTADWMVAAVLFVAFEPSTGTAFVPPTQVPAVPHVLWPLVGAVMTLSLALRRRHPLGVWVISTLSAMFLLAVIGSVDPFVGRPGFWSGILGSPLIALPAPVIALYTIARGAQSRGRWALAGSLIAIVPAMFWSLRLLSMPGNPVHSLERSRGLLTAPILGSTTKYLLALVAAGAFITAWVLGEMVRSRSEALAESAAIRRAAAEAEKAEHDRAVAAEERARIARELHDITAHHISVVTLQAGAARLLAESGQAPSAELLRGIESAARQAMFEIRQALGVIRSSPDGAAPLPGLARLPELTAQMELGGLVVNVHGAAGALAGGVDLTAYRIVQEGLANVARHSAARTAEVGLRRAGGVLEVTVADAGPARPAAAAPGAADGGPGGHGLIGLRERVAGYGGQLAAGPQPGGGFLLRATLPLHEDLEQADQMGPDPGQVGGPRWPATAAP